MGTLVLKISAEIRNRIRRTYGANTKFITGFNTKLTGQRRGDILLKLHRMPKNTKVKWTVHSMASIFIVDDEENLHQIYKALFTMKGHKVVGSAFDGNEAVQLFLKMNPKPDVIIMDHRMPRMDGISATKMIQEINAHSKIIFVSADETVRSEAIEAGAAVFQVKPVRAKELFRIIEMIAEDN